MTSAPPDLLEVQAYAHAKTGQDWSSLGIIHSTPQGGGYHEGEDLLIQAGTAPGPQYPGSDYSYTDAPGRDLLPSGRLAGGNYASAFDLGGNFPRFLEFNAWLRVRMLANDPRTRDIREFIHTLDGRTVRRIDRTGVQGDGGDDSHLSHSHISFFRDSVGRRSQDDNFLGLLREFFDGQEVDMNLTDTFLITNFTKDPRVPSPESTTVAQALGFAQQCSWMAYQDIKALRSELTARDAAEKTRDAMLMKMVEALVPGDGAGAASIVDTIRAEGEATRQAVLAQHAEDRQREAAAAQAEADALRG